MGKSYLYNEQDEPLPVEITEEEIIAEYFPYWKTAMVKKFGEGHELITHENCIEDWVVVHWAWENVKLNAD